MKLGKGVSGLDYYSAVFSFRCLIKMLIFD